MPPRPSHPLAADRRPGLLAARTDHDGAGELQDILSAPPRALVRGGTGSVLLVLLFLLMLSALIPYPETVAGRVVVSRLRPPVSVVAPRAGRLVQWRIRPETMVTNGAVLAVIESAADPEAVLALEAWLEAAVCRPAGLEAPSFPTLDPAAQLGELQPAWTELVTRGAEYHALLGETHFAEKAALLTNQIATLRTLIERLPAQQRLLERERDLVRRDFQRQETLAREGLLSPSQLAEGESALLVKERECVQAGSTLLQSQAQVLESEQALADLHRQRRDEMRAARQARDEARKGLRAQLAVWEAQHVLRAPVEGTVACFKFWDAQQHVAAGEEVVTVIPAGDGLRGRMLVPERGAGRVRPGQAVRVHLDGFPALEFGSVRGVVESVSAVPREGAHLVTLGFPAGLATGRGAPLPGGPELHGDAQIVATQSTLLGRLFHAWQARAPAEPR
jgi:multidrug resistance efflux pump